MLAEKKQGAIRILSEKFKNFDIQTEVRGDNRNSPTVIGGKEKASIRVEARISIFEFPSAEKIEARMVRTSKSSGEAAELNDAEDLAVYRAINNLGILGDNNE